MKLNKPMVLFLLLSLSWSTLLSACGVNPPPSSASSGRRTPTVTTTATITREATPTSMVAQPADCPTPGTTRAANMPTDTTTAQPAVFYLTGTGSSRFFTRQDLKRYDVATGKTTTIYYGIGGAWPELPMPALSPDKHWLLFSSPGPITDKPSSRLLLMRTDGTQLQTLSCGIVLENQGDLEGGLIWSPDGQQVAYSGSPNDNGSQTGQWKQTIHVLNLPTGQEKLYLTNTPYTPYAWLDNQRLYVSQDVGDSPLASTRGFFLLDISKGVNQKPGDLVHIASTHAICGDLAVSTDRQKVYTTSCSPTFGVGQGAVSQGPVDVNEQPATGGSSKSLFSHQGQAIVDIQAIDVKTVLMYIVDTHAGCTQQNGLWEMNTETRSLNQLVISPENGNCSEELSYRDTSPQIASNSQSYTLLVTYWRGSTNSLQQTLQVGGFSGGTPTLVTATDTCSCGLILVGMVYHPSFASRMIALCL